MTEAPPGEDGRVRARRVLGPCPERSEWAGPHARAVPERGCRQSRPSSPGGAGATTRRVAPLGATHASQRAPAWRALTSPKSRELPPPRESRRPTTFARRASRHEVATTKGVPPSTLPARVAARPKGARRRFPRSRESPAGRSRVRRAGRLPHGAVRVVELAWRLESHQGTRCVKREGPPQTWPISGPSR